MRAALALLAALLCLPFSASAGVPPEQKCQAAKNKAAGAHVVQIDSQRAWQTSYGDGNTFYGLTIYPAYVRAVRGDS